MHVPPAAILADGFRQPDGRVAGWRELPAGQGTCPGTGVDAGGMNVSWESVQGQLGDKS